MAGYAPNTEASQNINQMEFTLAQIAAILQGALEGNAQERVKTIGKIQDAQKGAITFLSNPKYENFIYFQNIYNSNILHINGDLYETNGGLTDTAYFEFTPAFGVGPDIY